MPISPSNFPDLNELHNGEQAISTVFNRPHFALSTRTIALKALLETVEGEVVNARDGYDSLGERLDNLFGDSSSDRNMFLSGAVATWTASASTFTFTTITLLQPQKSFNYTITGATISSIADGESLYVTLSRDSGASTLTMSKAATVPEGKDIYVIAVRNGTRLWVRGAGEFEDTETREIGDGVTEPLLSRLGMTSESDSDSHFTNVTFFTVTDNIPTALSNLGLNLEYLVRDRNTLLHGGGNVGWSSGALSFDSDFYVTVPAIGKITIAASTLSSIADGEVVYFTFTRTGTNYTKTLSKTAATSLPLSYSNTNNYVVGYRDGDKFVFRTGDVYQDGEVKPLGVGGAGLTVFENQSMYASSENDVSWDATSGLLDCVGNITINFPWTTYSNVIQDTEFPITLSTSGKKAYVVLDRSAQSNVTVYEDVDSIPLSYAAPDVLLVAERHSDSVYLFGNHRYNDGDIRRVGEGFVAGEIYDESYVVTGSEQTVITLPNGGEHADDGVTLKVWANGNFIEDKVQYDEGASADQIIIKDCPMFPGALAPLGTRFRFRRESIVTGGAGGGGSRTGGDEWSDPVDSHIIPETDNTYTLGSTAKAFKHLYLSDLVDNGDIWRLQVNSGSFSAVKVV